MSYEEAVKAIENAADTQIPALFIKITEEAIRRDVFRDGAMDRIIGRVKRQVAATPK